MAVSTIGVADAAIPDKYLHTWSRTIGGTAREDQFTLPGQAVYPTYTVAFGGLTAATAASHVLQIMGDGTNYSRIIAIRMWGELADAAGQEYFQLVRLSSAGTGGTAVTVSPFDTSDTYAGAAARLPTTKGTEGAALLWWRLQMPAAGSSPGTYEWLAHPHSKPIIFGPATSDGVAIKAEGKAGAVVTYQVEFITTSFL